MKMTQQQPNQIRQFDFKENEIIFYDSQIHSENNYSASSNNNNYLKTNNNTNFPNSNSKTCERCKFLEAKIDDLNTKFDNMLDYLKKMMEVQAKQSAQLSVLVNKDADMRNLSKLFLIKTIEEMESVNNAINQVNINEYINAIKHLLKGDPEKHFEKIISRSMCNEVNVGGVHGKICLKKYTSLYDVIIITGGLSATSEKPDKQLSKCLHIVKKRLYRLTTVNKLKIGNN
ncbi:histone H2B.v2-like isoform X1 [Bactrocera neohumeralis]|uniref:histone H2B.v2-like isoform X1 n=1 Tax=Bactrocera neohumeralis TaxID=98809 RepID=UPI0021654739|nr:histone H2B.v2-like isoform X1 [Bactrocera neohumeralis]